MAAAAAAAGRSRRASPLVGRHGRDSRAPCHTSHLGASGVARLREGRAPVYTGRPSPISMQLSSNNKALRRHSECHQHAISMPSACHQQAISRPSAGKQHAISMPSACHQHAISRQTAGHQQANSRPAPRTPARAVAVEGARAWVPPAADPVARRLRRARCRRRCTPPDEGRNE